MIAGAHMRPSGPSQLIKESNKEGSYVLMTMEVPIYRGRQNFF